MRLYTSLVPWRCCFRRGRWRVEPGYKPSALSRSPGDSLMWIRDPKVDWEKFYSELQHKYKQKPIFSFERDEEDPLNKKYYDLLKATEGFYMGDLTTLTLYKSYCGVVDFNNDDVEAISCAGFALHRFNEKQGKKLKFVRLVRVNGLVKSDVMYWMTIEASDGKFYEAKVHDHTPFGVLELLFIRPAVHYPPKSDDELLTLAMVCAAERKYYGVLRATENFYVGNLRKLSLYPRWGGVGTNSIDNPKVIELARFALDWLNKDEGTKLELKKLVGVNTQIESSMRYWITMEASNGKFYEAKLYAGGSKYKELEFIRHAVHYPSDTLNIHPR